MIYLGFDSSTQSFTVLAIAVEAMRRDIIFEHHFTFDNELPRYGTRHGVLPHDDPLVAHSSPRMWAEALDRMMEVVAREGGFDLTQVAAISGSAQQHGSVYLNAAAAPALGALEARRPLVAQIDGIFSRAEAPIWMDASTEAQCAAITKAFGDPEATARLTGSRAAERFTGPQIRKFAEDDSEAYADTARIHLVSSFLASLLIGEHAPLDPGDASGTNLMDLATRRWSPKALDATAPSLAQRLPRIVPSWNVVGTLAPYWQERYGFGPAPVVAWSGDNPCSAIGTGLVREGTVALSLGTSDTVFAPSATPRFDPDGWGNVFGSPTGEYLSLICCRNGSLARERVRDQFGLDWDAFGQALRETPPGNDGKMLLPWFEPEMTPLVMHPHVRRFDLDPSDGPGTVRALVEAQMMALAIHSRWMGNVERIHATGGAAANAAILQVMADVHDAPVHQLEVGNSACLGAALRAYHAAELSAGRAISWSDVIAAFVEPATAPIHPIGENVETYRALMRTYAARETKALALRSL